MHMMGHPKRNLFRRYSHGDMGKVQKRNFKRIQSNQAEGSDGAVGSKSLSPSVSDENLGTSGKKTKHQLRLERFNSTSSSPIKRQKTTCPAPVPFRPPLLLNRRSTLGDSQRRQTGSFKTKKTHLAPDDVENLSPEKLTTKYAPDEHIDEVHEVEEEVEDSILDGSCSNSNQKLRKPR